MSEGKIFLEVERARLTRILADMQEADGDLASAARGVQSAAAWSGGWKAAERVREGANERLREQ